MATTDDTSAPVAVNGSERVHDEIREAILHGRLGPGAEMSQVQLARDLGVSRTPLREALRMLQREGLIEARANRRVRVADFSIADLEQLYALRVTGESMAIRLSVPQMTTDDDEFLEQSLAQMERSAGARDIDGWETYHREFHTRLVRNAGDRIERHLRELSDHSERYRRLYIEQEPRAWNHGIAEHAAIAQACADRDGSRAAGLLAQHLARTALTVVMIAVPEHEPSTVRTALRNVVPTSNEALSVPKGDAR